LFAIQIGLSLEMIAMQMNMKNVNKWLYIVHVWNTALDEPHSLLILAEEELVALDLSSDEWLTYSVPYMCSLHNSAVTCLSHIVNVPDTLWTKLTDVGRQQTAACSQRVM